MNRTIDDIDRSILDELTKDSRLSVRQLADHVHISRTAAHNRLQRLVNDGILQRFTIDVDKRALGLTVTAIVIVRIGQGPWPELAQSLAEIPHVESVKALSGNIDFLVEVSAPDHETLSETVMQRIRTMPGIVATTTHLVLDDRRGSEHAQG